MKKISQTEIIEKLCDIKLEEVVDMMMRLKASEEATRQTRQIHR